MNYYILMADIIESGQKNAESLMLDLKLTVAQINQTFKHLFYSPATITLGDEFQCVVKSLRDGVEIIINFEELLIKKNKNFKLKYILNYGDIQTPINKKNAYEMLGPGLTETRGLLENQKGKNDRFLIKYDDITGSEKINLAFKLYQSLVDRWKIKDFKIISAFLENSDYKKVAKMLHKEVSLMWKRNKSLQIAEYLAAKKLLYLLME